jgi:tRNA U34 5-carboxymethylaminomethyl modifying GTPase MnmE/TrmE
LQIFHFKIVESIDLFYSNKLMNNDVICAISTPPGMGAIATVRLSGEGCIALTDKVFLSPSGKKTNKVKSQQSTFRENHIQ